MTKSLEALKSLRQECRATYFDETGQQWWTSDKSEDYRCNIIEKELKLLDTLLKYVYYSNKSHCIRMREVRKSTRNFDYEELKEALND